MAVAAALATASPAAVSPAMAATTLAAAFTTAMRALASAALRPPAALMHLWLAGRRSGPDGRMGPRWLEAWVGRCAVARPRMRRTVAGPGLRMNTGPRPGFETGPRPG